VTKLTEHRPLIDRN